MNSSSSVCAFIDLECGQGCKAAVVKQILESVQPLDELKFGSSFVESLSNLEIHAISHLLLKCKSLTLEGSYGFSFVHIFGIAYALQSSPLIERLVVNLHPYKYQPLVDLSGLDHPKSELLVME